MAQILVIDDDLVSRKYLKTTCENLGHQVIEASGGEEGITAARSGRPDLVIVDFLMPGKGGLDTLEAIKSELPNSRFILVSGKIKTDSEAFREALAQVGADEYMFKPVTSTALAGVLSKLLKH